MTEEQERQAEPNIVRAKVTYEFVVIADNAPNILATFNGPIREPFKVKVSDFRTRARVEVSGKLDTSFGQYRSVSYILYDNDGRYENIEKRTCPDWLVPLIRESGYSGKINGHE